MDPIVTYALEFDDKKIVDASNNDILDIPVVDNYYNIKTINESFDIMTSYLTLDEQVLFPLSNSNYSSSTCGFKTTKDLDMNDETVSLKPIDNKRKFLTFNIIEDNAPSADHLKTLFAEYLINQPRYCSDGKINHVYLCMLQFSLVIFLSCLSIHRLFRVQGRHKFISNKFAC